mmetsp:Transcript_74265/g.231437  ORF Transcript_74265/g.231437 Transcript_74265/m.231437 type:complete len:88 (+) Transcript_74265:230-493(+)
MALQQQQQQQQQPQQFLPPRVWAWFASSAGSARSTICFGGPSQRLAQLEGWWPSASTDPLCVEQERVDRGCRQRPAALPPETWQTRI